MRGLELAHVETKKGLEAVCEDVAEVVAEGRKIVVFRRSLLVTIFVVGLGLVSTVVGSAWQLSGKMTSIEQAIVIEKTQRVETDKTLERHITNHSHHVDPPPLRQKAP